MVERAREKIKHILETHRPEPVSAEVRERIETVLREAREKIEAVK